MPKFASVPYMTGQQLRELLNGFDPGAKTRLADDLDKSVSQINRWLSEHTPISQTAAMAIRRWEYRQHQLETIDGEHIFQTE